MIHAIRLFALTVLAALLVAGPASAAEPSGTLYAAAYWSQFLEYWQGVFQKQNGIVMGILCVGAVSLFIITRGKWRK